MGVPPLLQQRGQLVRLVTPLVVRHVRLFQALDRLAQALCGQLVLFQTLVALAFTFPQLHTHKVKSSFCLRVTLFCLFDRFGSIGIK